MTPEISVIIPYYEGEKWLAKAVSSVLAQTGVELEIIVVDDGSKSRPDAMIASLNNPGIRLLAIGHAGKGAAINAGVRMSRSDCICVLDQDDVMLANRLDSQLKALHGNPAIDAVYSDYERRTESGELIDTFISRPADNAQLLHAMAAATGLFSMQTLTLRKKAFVELKGFSEDIRLTGLDDAEFFSRLLARGVRLGYVPGVFACWVSHSANYSKSREFYNTRLVLLDRLSELAALYPAIKKELPHFKHHAYYMRGLSRLEANDPRAALREFVCALKCDPCSPDLFYLIGKSFFLALAG